MFFAESLVSEWGGVSGTQFNHSPLPVFMQDQDLSICCLELLDEVVAVELCHRQTVAAIVNTSKIKDSLISIFLIKLVAVYLRAVDNQLMSYLSCWHL